MSAAAQIVAQDGYIAAAARCNDGFPEHGNFRSLLFEHGSPRALLDTIEAPGFSLYDQWEAQLLALIRLKARVGLLSELAGGRRAAGAPRADRGRGRGGRPRARAHRLGRARRGAARRSADDPVRELSMANGQDGQGGASGSGRSRRPPGAARGRTGTRHRAGAAARRRARARPRARARDEPRTTITRTTITRSTTSRPRSGRKRRASAACACRGTSARRSRAAAGGHRAARPASGAGADRRDAHHLHRLQRGPASRCRRSATSPSSSRRHRPEWSAVRWINVDGLTDLGVIRALAEKYHLHPLAIEDVLHVPQRPEGRGLRGDGRATRRGCS